MTAPKKKLFNLIDVLSRLPIVSYPTLCAASIGLSERVTLQRRRKSVSHTASRNYQSYSVLCRSCGRERYSIARLLHRTRSHRRTVSAVESIRSQSHGCLASYSVLYCTVHSSHRTNRCRCLARIIPRSLHISPLGLKSSSCGPYSRSIAFTGRVTTFITSPESFLPLTPDDYVLLKATVFIVLPADRFGSSFLTPTIFGRS